MYRQLEKGSVLMEALLMIGLFLLFILIINRSIVGYASSIEKIDKASNERVERVNQEEVDRLNTH